MTTDINIETKLANMTDLEKAQAKGDMAAEHFRELEKSIIAAKDRAKIYKCDQCEGRSRIDISEVTSILGSFYHIFEKYEEEILYTRFDYEELLDRIAEVTVALVDAFSEDFDAESWNEIHSEDPK